MSPLEQHLLAAELSPWLSILPWNWNLASSRLEAVLVLVVSFFELGEQSFVAQIEFALEVVAYTVVQHLDLALQQRRFAALVAGRSHWPVWEDVAVLAVSGTLLHTHPHIAELVGLAAALPPVDSHCIVHCSRRTADHTLDHMPAAHIHHTAALDTRIHSALVVPVADCNMLDVEVHNERSHRTPF